MCLEKPMRTWVDFLAKEGSMCGQKLVILEHPSLGIMHALRDDFMVVGTFLLRVS